MQALYLSIFQLREAIFSGEVARCKLNVNDAVCNGVIKPDIVMFGESLPQVNSGNFLIYIMNLN